LIHQLTELETEKQRLLELQRLRQENSDLIIHDLRNPIGSISLAVDMLEMVLPEDIRRENRELLDVAHASADRLMRLVESLLEVSRMEAGEVQFHFAPLHLAELVTGVTGRMLVPAARDVKIEPRLPPNLPQVPADRDKLERVLQNLVDNALKYTPDHGSVVVAVELQAAQVTLSVTDAGPGIPEDQRKRIFERFAQVAGGARGRRGFGLGLAYCRLAVEAHGGRIWADPGPGGVGSRFAFTLPLS
jgi:signal transduction histidine kinase